MGLIFNHTGAQEKLVQTELFFKGQSLLPEKDLRGLARAEVLTSPLIQACREGDRNAAVALHVGFWEFVRQFELVIDERGKELLKARHALSELFPNTAEVIMSIAKAVRVMKQEEGSHARIWLADAEGADFGDLKRTQIADGVQELIDWARSAPLWTHFCILGGTEYIAEELSRVLARESPRFVQHFEDDRWRWGEVHLADHHHGPSHREIDEDIARALYMAEHPGALEPEVLHDLYMAELEAIRLFGKASRDVALLCNVRPVLQLAAE